jgi:hypothetical protein
VLPLFAISLSQKIALASQLAFSIDFNSFKIMSVVSAFFGGSSMAGAVEQEGSTTTVHSMEVVAATTKQQKPSAVVRRPPIEGNAGTCVPVMQHIAQPSSYVVAAIRKQP